MKYLKIEENQDEDLVRINGLEIAGHIADGNCSACQLPRIYYEDYDAYFCPRCNIWLEHSCSDSTCEFCTKRPQHPLPNPLITDWPLLDALADDTESINQIVPMVREDEPAYTPEMITLRLNQLLDIEFIFTQDNKKMNSTEILEDYVEGRESDLWFGMTERGRDWWKEQESKLYE